MTTSDSCRSINPTRQKRLCTLAAGTLALALGLLASVGNVHAVTYAWTNTTGAVFNDPNAWNPVGGPGTNLDVANVAVTGTLTISLTNDFSNIGSVQFGAAAGGQVLNLNLDFGTNVFAGISGNTSSASGFVFGQAGTTIVYIAVGTMYCTNSTGNARMIIGRNGPAIVNLTSGNVKAGNLILANGPAASTTRLIISGANSYWTNNSIAVGNAANASNVAVVVSNSATLACTNGFTVGAQSPNLFCSILVDSNARLVSSNQTATIGAGTGSSTNSVTVQGGGIWDVGARPINIGNGGGGIGNALIVGDSGKVQNVTALTLNSAGNALNLSGGVFSASIGVTNNSGTVGGFGTIAGSVIFASAGTLSPGLGTLVGKLTISNDLTLVSASTTKIKLDSSQTGSNDAINVVGTATIGGTLAVVTNGTAPLVAGDVYNIGITGSFSTTNLPPLDPSARWNNVTPGLLAIVPQEVVPGISGPTNQVVNIGETVVISTTVTGVPAPGVYWQKDGINVTDGPTGNGSTNSGSATTTLTISNAQTNDSGSYCLIATNIVGAATNCMALTVSSGNVAPSLSGVSDQTVIQGNTGTFNASVAGSPAPVIRWQENGFEIAGATGVPLILTNVQFLQNGYVYSIIASNVAGTATTNMTLTVIITPTISAHPQNLVVTNTQSASFSVTASGVPAPTYQWLFNNNNIGGATNATYTIASANPTNAGTYKVTVSNAAGSVTSSNASLTVNSTMVATLTPSNVAANVCYDTPLYMAFDKTPFRSGTGKILIYLAGTTNIVETIDTGLGNLQNRTIGGENFFVFPIIITGNIAAIYPRNGILSSNKTYYATVDPGTFTDTNGALHAGITSTNGWVFTTKPTGPLDPINIIVDAAGNGDFCTVQGAVDFVPLNNGTKRLLNIRNGDYNELVNTRTKSNITFRGQSRAGTIVGYRNNDNQNPGTANRMAFKVVGDDTAIENITITNRTPKGGSQAEAIRIDTNIKRFICYNATVASYQDTILGNTSGTQCYFKDSLIAGDTDFIWGGMNAFFTNCEIRCLSTGSHVTQARSDAGSNGIAFLHCQVTRATTNITNGSCDLGRALGFADGNVYYRYCLIDSHISGWAEVSNRDWEWGNSNITASAAVTYNGIQTNVPCADDVSCWLYGWTPSLAPNILSGPTNLTVTPGQSAAFTVVATGIPDPTYQWLKAGTNLTGQTSATLSIPTADSGDAGSYSVIVTTTGGSVTSSTATLTVVLNAFQTWQNQYFGCTFCAQAAASADPDGDGLTNDMEFQAGTNPTNSASALQIISESLQSPDIVITWTTAGGRTNVVQSTAGDGSGNYTNNFADIPGSLTILPGSGDQTTNYTDSGGATNVPSRYYRVRLVP